MSDVVCLGQFTADVVVTPVESLPEKGKAIFVDNISLHNGGCACNTAVALGKLGIDTAVIGKVGCDAFGDFLIKVMNETNLDTTAIVRDSFVNTSSTAVMVSPDGERSFLHYSGGNAKMSEDDVNYDVIKAAKILHVAAAFNVPGLDGEPMARVLARARKMGVTTSFDTAWDAKGRWMKLVEPCLHHVDIFVPSLEEAQMLTGKQSGALPQRGSRARDPGPQRRPARGTMPIAPTSTAPHPAADSSQRSRPAAAHAGYPPPCSTP